MASLDIAQFVRVWPARNLGRMAAKKLRSANRLVLFPKQANRFWRSSGVDFVIGGWRFPGVVGDADDHGKLNWRLR